MENKVKQIIFGMLVISYVIVLSGCPRGVGSGANAGKVSTKPVSPDSLVYMGLDGKGVNLGEASEGKPLFITFFASWCSVCAEETPENNEIYTKYAADGVIAMYAVNIGDSKKKIEDMIDKRGILYPVLMDEKMESQHTFQLMGLPLNVVYDRNGNEVYRDPKLPSEDVFAKVLAR